ncbi:Armadillo repeat-containing protein 3 [Dinochytrium kinnereticum]|nr:Armadillo repeat-containing protein 3 [Dinochytrium kinnereticum]
MDALDKLLNYNLSAKYWLKNELSFENVIRDGFYDYGSAGFEREPVKNFQTLIDLRRSPVDTRREVLLVDNESDAQLVALCSTASASILGCSKLQQIQHIASLVCNQMGGPVNPSVVGEFSHKFKITELKLRTGTNILPLGSITTGTFYHRALLFKVICDKIGLGPCSLTRGEYKRAWNTIDFRRFGMTAVSAPPSKAQTPVTPNRKASSVGRSTVSSRERQLSSEGPAFLQTTKTPAMDQKSIMVGDQIAEMTIAEIDEPVYDELVIVDLMFEPGRLLLLSSDEAVKYRFG